jgi:uncharacterized protein YbcI
MGGELRAGVEALTGRRVVAFMSANHVEPDLAAEIFVLGDPLPEADGPDEPSVGPREQVG